MKCLLCFIFFIYFYLFTFTYLFVLLVFCYSRPINCNHQNGNKEGLKYFTFLLSVVFMEMSLFFLFNNEETALFQYIQIFELHI